MTKGRGVSTARARGEARTRGRISSKDLRKIIGLSTLPGWSGVEILARGGPTFSASKPIVWVNAVRHAETARSFRIRVHRVQSPYCGISPRNLRGQGKFQVRQAPARPRQ